MAEIISAVYKITNTITGDFYIGSSKNVKRRWAAHKSPPRWRRCSNNPMYLDMQKYGVDKFEFQVITEVESEYLKEKEQQFIEMLKPTYNNRNADGLNIERRKKYKKEYQKEYQKTDKGKEYHRKAQNKYQKTEKYKEYHKSDKCKEYQKEYNKKYYNQLCCYNGETLTLGALRTRFKSQGIPHPVLEAKKYLVI